MHQPLLDATATPLHGTQRHSIFGVEFSTWSLDRLVDTIVDEPVPTGAGLRLLVTANLDHIVNLTRSAGFRAAYRYAWLAVIDGTPVWLYARLRGLDIAGRVTGADLFPAILARLQPGPHRPFLVCSTEASAAALRQKLAGLGFDDPQSVVVAPLGFEHDLDYGLRLLRTLRERRITHLFFGIGAPKSEIWMDRHRAELPDCYGFGFGAGLDFFAGTKRRAPPILRRMGVEFLWRVATEPRRLARRYFVSSWIFLRAVALDLAGKPLEPR